MQSHIHSYGAVDGYVVRCAASFFSAPRETTAQIGCKQRGNGVDLLVLLLIVYQLYCCRRDGSFHDRRFYLVIGMFGGMLWVLEVQCL